MRVLWVVILAAALVSLAGAQTPGSVTPTSVTVEGLECGTLYRVRVNAVGVPGATTLRMTTAPCDEPPPPPPPPPPGGEPGPIAGQGYTLSFDDQFTTLDRDVWCEKQWWEDPPAAGSQVVLNGELRLRRARSSNYQNVSVSTEPTADCALASPKVFRQGYFEASIRYEPVRGNNVAWWIIGSRHATNTSWPTISPVCEQLGEPRAHCLASELDIVELYGNIQYGGTRLDDWWSGTLHRNTSGFYGEPDTTRGLSDGTGLDFGEYHTYAARWTLTDVCWYLDEAPMGCVPVFDSTDQPSHLILSNWNTPWETENMPNSTTEDELDMWVDWVRVWTP